ncbi:MAG TPA: hypothetical protein VFE77_02975 [Rhodanobacter sp.]|nr:hypothetical protein [Rhodanobacter sp.]
MAYDILKSSTESALLFFLTLASDHISPATGLSPTVTISKNGGAFGSPSGAVSEIANGWYKVAGNATDTGTLGPLALHASVSTADNCDMIVANIVAFDPQNANSLGLAVLPATAIPGASGGLFIAGTNAATVITTSLTTHFVGTVDTLTTYTGNTVQTGDAYARLGAPAGASTAADIAAAKVNLVTLVAGVNVSEIDGQTASAAGTVTFPGTLASPTNITAGTIATVTNLTNAPTSGDLTATMKTSVTTAASAATPVATVSGDLSATMKTSVTTAASAATPVATVSGDLSATMKTSVTTAASAATPAVSVGSGGITSTSFASGAIANAAFASGAISGAVFASDAMTVLAADAITEAYPTVGAGLTLAKALYSLHQQVYQQSITTTTMTILKRDQATTAKTATINSATAPTAITEAS